MTLNTLKIINEGQNMLVTTIYSGLFSSWIFECYGVKAMRSMSGAEYNISFELIDTHARTKR